MHAALRFALPAALLILTPLAHAEKADRSKPVIIDADRAAADDRNKVVTYEGQTHLTQGTLEITSEKLIVTQDADGFQKGTAIGGKDGLARFRQKKEGKNEYIEGEAERIEYDGRTDKAKLFVRAFLRSGQNETRAQYIEYDGYTELYTVSGSADGKSAPGTPGQRVRTVLMPKDAAPTPASK